MLRIPRTPGVCALLLGLFVGSPLLAEENTLTEYEKKAGWKLLFDGTSTAGWRNFRKEGIGEGWKVVDGALVRSDRGAGDIITTDKYGSFELSLDYRISKGGNSGIMFHVTEDSDAPWHSGPEVQVQDNVDGHDPQKSGWLYQLYNPGADRATGDQVDATKPAGEWNNVQLRITPVGCEINVNGVRYARFDLGSEDWNARVAKSKFAEYAQFGKAGEGFICLQDHGNDVAYRNIKIRPVGADGSVPNPVDGTLPLKVELAFPDLEWKGWEPVDEDGRPQSFRPLVLTHANDGSNRVFLASQHGVIYVFKNDQSVKESKVFLDIRDRVTYRDDQNEEGFLGLAFHPNYKENGELYIYYTSSRLEPHTCLVSRFRVGKSDPDRAEPGSEEEVMRIPQPFWNHKGGTVAFGPDGYLYVGLGDGGAANDPFRNGQDLSTLLGSILRIDVDARQNGRGYGIPKDNPFVGKENAAPEIFAYGVRNIWRLSFDRQTGSLWAADVGQNLWEEINIVTNGGNYGWNLREGTHAFGSNGSGPRADLVEPVWEYDHQVGLSITGGLVYRGEEVPELQGKYVYGDYVTGRLWALNYDAAAAKVVSNEEIPSEKLAVVSFGEDQQGEIYVMIVTANGKGIYRIVRAGA